MQELIQAWTRAGNALAAYLEKSVPDTKTRLCEHGHPAEPETTADASAAEPAPKTRKPRAPKEEKPAEAAAPAVPSNPNDDILGPSVAAAKTSAPAEMTEDESAKAATARAKTLMQRFDKIAPGQEALPEAQRKPEGYMIAKKIMADHFRVARIADLVHAQRLQFIILADQVLAKGA